jgi:hypothetical protein
VKEETISGEMQSKQGADKGEAETKKSQSTSNSADNDYVGKELCNFFFLELSSISLYEEIFEISFFIIILNYTLIARGVYEIINYLNNKRMFIVFH